MRIIKTLVIILLFCSSLSSRAEQNNSQQVTPDVRLLIDISGSMKKNDPNNLRIPALQLVTNLMPQGAEAGVWAFGRYVNMMVPLSKVDTKWQDKATQTANKINSAGLFTNIGGVLKSASFGWTAPNPLEKRSLILLTDGMVDISKDPQVNSAERKKILEQILPKLVKAKVKIHTIALSKNADHELLKALSTQTDGWYEAVDSAEALQKVFLKIFEQSAARDSLPLTDNHFNVDPSIEEMTLLVFKKNPLDTTRLITPDESIFADATADGQVRWFTTAGYDLITVKTPQPGKWKIDANVDPDNRVMVVSKLSLNVSEVPNNLLAGEAINYQVSLLEEGQLITKPDFLNLVEARLTQHKQGQTSRLAMFFDSQQHQFKQNFFTDNVEGVLNLTLEIKSPTFERKRNHAVNVYGSPLKHELTLSSDEKVPHQLELIVRQDIVKAETLKVNATITFPDEEKQYLALDELSKPLDIKIFAEGGDYSVALDIKGQSILGRDFSITPAPITFNAPATPAYLASQQKLQEQDKAPEKEPAQEEEKVVQPEEVVDEPPVEQEPLEEETDWTFWLLIGLGVNLILGALGFVGWKIIKSKSLRSTSAITEELSIEEDEDGDNEQVDNQKGEEKE